MKFFLYDDVSNDVVLNDESILLVRELAALMEINRNKCLQDKTGKQRLLAFRELKYIYLFFD
jgi:hypothetical protein